jgi:microcystin-dependent protein
MDIYSSNWDESDAANSSAAPDGAPEGMAPAGINDVLRAHQGGIKRYVNQQIPKTTAGSATAFTLDYSVAPGDLVDGMTHLVQFNATNGASPTLNVNSLGAKPLHYYSAGAWRVVPAALWAADAVFRVAYNSATGTYRILGLPDRTGVVEAFAGATAPAGSLLCFGQAISRTAYAGLFAALSTTHGVGDGSTTFNLPDLRGRVVAGQDDMGGTSANRLTTAVLNGDTLGAAGGSETTPGPTGAGAVDASAPTANVASVNHTHIGGAVQPTIILNYVIRI